jgi:HlyD family secretion protein
MKNRLLFVMSAVGFLAAVGGAYFFGIPTGAQPPVFNPASNPYADGIFANGIVESYQQQGTNVNIYPVVSGTIRQVLVKEGDSVRADTPMVVIDDSVQRALAGQQKAQAEAALAQLRQLKAQPRPETLAVAKAQLDLDSANLKNLRDQFDKQKLAYSIDPAAVSRDALDTAANELAAAQASEDVARKQLALTQAGAWRFDIANQERQAEAASQAYRSASALLDKFTIRAPVDGVVLTLSGAVGSFASPQGVYDPYTQAAVPMLVMGGRQDYLGVRCFIDEILIGRIPPPGQIGAQMFIRGTGARVPLEFVRMQPFVSPKIALSNQRQERVDLRVLPLIFRFRNQPALNLYPGQLVDVYVGKR